MEYEHGGDIYSQQIDVDFSTNLSPLGIPEGVKEAVSQGIFMCARYPDSRCKALREALAEYHQVPEEWIICGNGAAELIFNLAFGLKPQKAIVPSPTFSEYGSALSAAGCEITHFDLKEEEGFALKEEEFCRFLEERGSKGNLVFLCNPNNPTGLVSDCLAVKKIAAVCRQKQMILVADECFCDFLLEPEQSSILPYLKEFPNVMVLKAFTKTYALAGIRLGYGICADVKILEQMEQVRQPWSVSVLAQEAGIAALKEKQYVERVRTLIGQEREFLKAGLENLGFLVWDSRANYLFFKDKIYRENWLYQRLLEKKVLIRSCGNYRGLDGHYYRICIKTRKENEEFLQILKAVLD
ncbi:MAG: pyridoxal phosphate-dependent aminotransferase [Lachnospiraceae bacterium]